MLGNNWDFLYQFYTFFYDDGRKQKALAHEIATFLQSRDSNHVFSSTVFGFMELFVLFIDVSDIHIICKKINKDIFPFLFSFILSSDVGVRLFWENDKPAIHIRAEL